MSADRRSIDWGDDVVDTQVRSGFGAAAAPAQRNRKARWKDGRLVLGVLLVAVTALAGAKLLSSADDTTTVWAAKHELRVGSPLTNDDLTTVRVRFTSSNDSGRYLSADADLKGLVVGRAVGQGEFVPKDAAVPKSDKDRTEMPLSVATGHLPPDIAVGDVVDVWVVPKEEGHPASQLWTGVRVLQVDSVKGVAGGSARRQVTIDLSSADQSRMGSSLAAINAGEPTLVRKAG
ncbi:SAF domain-containing protein [Kribbella sp. GL6]|uniref:SAF domain-containing protein n=1 Tax=Kribbella sp. GL6 TaxID=3419765 RepID=UPI003D02B34A